MCENKLILTGDIGAFTTRISFVFDQRVLRKVSSEARFADGENQFAVRKDGRVWQIQGNPSSVNQTTLNGVVLSGGARALKSGDVIAVKGRTSGAVALKITVSLGEVATLRPGGTSGTGKGGEAPQRALVAGLSADQKEFQELVVAGWRGFARQIDISDFMRRKNWSISQAQDALLDCKYNHPEIFYLVRSGMFSWTERADGKIDRATIKGIKYYFAPEEYPLRKAELDKAVAGALRSIAYARGPVERALGLHDYLIRTCEYDVKAAQEKDASPLARTVYSVLVRHSAVCEGYAMAYRYLLNAAGIVSEEARGVGIAHIWNYVQIEGRWYHVDVTWDDPVYSGEKPSDTFVSREHFLMSDKKAMVTGHPDWDVAGLPPADDESYDHKKWGSLPVR